MLIGIDVSKYNLGWNPMNATKPIGFGIQRASWSLYKDEKFDAIYQGIAQLPVRGAYHYYTAGRHAGADPARAVCGKCAERRG